MRELRQILFYGRDRPVFALTGTDSVAFSWSRCPASGDSFDELDPPHEHTIECLWVWHDCNSVYPDEPPTVAKFRGQRHGWCPAGVGAHTLVQRDPLTITASVYWPDCCGVHGFITNGAWISA